MNLNHFTVDSAAISALIERLSGEPFWFVESERDNTFEYRYHIDGQPNVWDQKKWNDQVNGEKPLFAFRSIMQCLCANGDVQPGIYHIKRTYIWETYPPLSAEKQEAFKTLVDKGWANNPEPVEVPEWIMKLQSEIDSKEEK